MTKCRYCRQAIVDRTGHRPMEIVVDDPWRPTWECLVTGVELQPLVGCGRCGTPLSTRSTAQLPLLRHGGYGEVAGRVERWCAKCGWGAPTQAVSLSPRTS